MKKAKLIQVLKSLDKSELKSFEKYLTKLYGEHELAVALFQYLKPFYPAFSNDNKLDLDYITSKVFRLDKTKRISNEASKLLGWLEEFLILEKIKRDKDQYQVQKFMIEIYKERKLDQFYFREIEKAKEDIAQNRKDIWRALHLMEMNHAYYYHPFTEKLDVQVTYLEDAKLEGEAFFKLMGLKYQTELQNRKGILSIASNDSGEFEVLEAPKKIDEHYKNLFQVYSMAYQLFKTRNEEHYKQLCNYVFNYGKLLDSEDHFILLMYLINQIALYIKKGDKVALEEAFQLYKYGIDQKLLQIGGYITEVRFQNIVNIACELKQLDWLKTFIEAHENSLQEKWLEPSFNLAKASILFAERQFREALKMVRSIPTNKENFNLNIKMLELKSYYEIGDEFSEALESGIKSFDKQLVRNKVLHASTIEGGKNFLSMLRLILSGKYLRAELLEQLQSKKTIIGKYWLEEKIKELPFEKRQLRI